MSESSRRLWEGREDGGVFFCFTHGKIQPVGSGEAKVGTWSRFLPVLPFSPRHPQRQQPAGCPCPCTASWRRPSLLQSCFVLEKAPQVSPLCSQTKSSGQRSTFLRSHTTLWHRGPLLGVVTSSTAWCFSPVEREKFGRLQGLHQSTEISSKVGKMCNSSSGLIHCPDRGSEMIFKRNKGHSSSRVTFLPSLKSCRHKRVLCPRLCSACPAWLGFVSSSSAGWASLALQLFPSWAAACSVLVTCSPPTTWFFF